MTSEISAYTSSSLSLSDDLDNNDSAMQLQLDNSLPPRFFGDIEVSNSSEIHFGNTAVYNCPITVNQFVNNNQIITRNDEDEIVETALSSNDGKVTPTEQNFSLNGERQNENHNWYKKRLHKKELLIAIIIMILILCISFIVFFILISVTSSDGDEYYDEYESVINGSNYYHRIDCSAKPVTQYDFFKIKPLNLVIISHTKTADCLNKFECCSQIQAMQDFDIVAGYNDIQYNFLIGGDGSIYRGRGWNIIGELTNTSYDNISISIGVIGTFIYTLPNKQQLNALKIFLNESIRLNKLSRNYSLIAHRQVTKNYYPGLVFYEELKKWPHWSNRPNQPQEYFNDSDKSAPYYNREFWLLRPIKEIKEFRKQYLPLQYVIISHTGHGECFNTTECTNEVRRIQSLDMDLQKREDIGYNFLVGGDGGLYEGRGWDTVGVHSEGYNSISIGIALIGTFTDKLPTEKQILGLQLLIKQGVRLKKISNDYKLLGQCQVALINSPSPGTKFYNEILKTFTNWSPTV